MPIEPTKEGGASAALPTEGRGGQSGSGCSQHRGGRKLVVEAIIDTTRPVISLAVGDVWCPAREDEERLTRTIVTIDVTEQGALRIGYLVGETGDIIGSCLDTSFRQWVSKMKCWWSRNDDLVAALEESAESHG